MKLYLLPLLLIFGFATRADSAAAWPLWPRPQSCRFAADAGRYIPTDLPAAESTLASGFEAPGTTWSLGQNSGARAGEPLPPQGYRLSITPDGIAVTGADTAGLRNGLATLRQLARRMEDGTLYWPCVEISDAPVVPVRGAHFMLNQYPWSEENAAAARRFIDVLADLKYNLLVLQLDGLPAYRNDAFAGTEHWPMDQLAALGDYAKHRGFEVVPALQLGGHSVWLTGRPEFESYREKAPEQRGDPPSWDDTLCPSQEESTRLICSFIDELVDVFQPRRFLLGYDEMLAKDKLCSHCRRETAPMAELYARQVNTFAAYLRRRGVETMIWADQLLDFELRHALYGNRLVVDGPVFAAALDRDLTLAPWYYGADPAAFAVTDSYLRERGFRNFLGTCMCYDGNIRALADAIPRYGWAGGIHTFWYHAKGPALQSTSTYVWNYLPVFADAMWNAGRDGNSDRVNRLNRIRQVLAGNEVPVPVSVARQIPLSADDSAAVSMTTAGGVTVAIVPDRPFTELALPAGDADWAELYLALHCDSPEHAEQYQSPTDYDGCTTFPVLGSVDFDYVDGSQIRVPLQYNWNIVEANPEREIFGAERVFDANGSREITVIANPCPGRPLRQVVLTAATPTKLYYSGATAVAAVHSPEPSTLSQEER